MMFLCEEPLGGLGAPHVNHYTMDTSCWSVKMMFLREEPLGGVDVAAGVADEGLLASVCHDVQLQARLCGEFLATLVTLVRDHVHVLVHPPVDPGATPQVSADKRFGSVIINTLVSHTIDPDLLLLL